MVTNVIGSLHEAESLTEFTASNVVDSYTAEGYDVYEMNETSLAYPGHYGIGMWVLQCEYRVTDLTDLGFAYITLWSENNEQFYSLAGGMQYDTFWHPVHLIVPWMTSTPDTMHLRAVLATNGADDVIKFRNVRMTFLQIADKNAMYPGGNGTYLGNTSYRTMHDAVWTFTPFDSGELAPSTNTTLLSANITGVTTSDLGTLTTIFHVAGISGDLGGTNANNIHNRVYFNLGNTQSANAGVRAEPGFGKTLTWVAQNSNWSSSGGVVNPIPVSIVARNQTSTGANTKIGVAGGRVLMMFRSGNFFGGGQSSWGGSYPLLPNPIDRPLYSGFKWNVTAQTSPIPFTTERYLSFSAAMFGVSGNSAASGGVHATVRDANGASANSLSYDHYTRWKGGSANTNPGHLFALTTSELTPTFVPVGNTAANVTIAMWSRFSSANSGNVSIVDMKSSGNFAVIERQHINSTFNIGANAVNEGSATQTWTNLENIGSYDTSTYATMENVSTVAANNAYLRVTNFGFENYIPAGATIGFINIIPVCRNRVAGYSIVWDDVRMVVDGSAVGTSCAPGHTWNNGVIWDDRGPAMNFGTSTFWDLEWNTAGAKTRNNIWNYAPTASEVRSPSFGFQLRPRADGGWGGAYYTADVAYVAAVVYYRKPLDPILYSVTCIAGAVSGVATSHRGSTLSKLMTSTAIISLPKFTAREWETVEAPNTATTAKTPNKSSRSTIANVVRRSHLMTKIGLLTKSPTISFKKSVSNLVDLITVTKSLKWGKTARKTRAFTIGKFILWDKETDKATFSLTANNTPDTARTAVKALPTTTTTTTASRRDMTKRLRVVAASAKRLVKASVRKIGSATSIATALLATHRFIRYNLDLALTSTSVTALRKSMSASKALTMSSIISAFSTLKVKVINLSLITAASVVGPARRVVGKGLARQMTTTLRWAKGVSAIRSTSDAITAQLIKGIAREPSELTIDNTIVAGKTTTKGLARRSVGSVSRLVKVALQGVKATTASSTAAIYRGVAKIGVLAEASATTITKATTHKMNAIGGNVARVSKASIRNVGKAISGNVVALRRLVTKVVSTSFDATANISKRLSRRLVESVTTVLEAYTNITTRIQFITYVMTELRSFFQVAPGILRLRDVPNEDGRAEYINFLKVRLPDPETGIARMPEVDSSAVKVSNREEGIKKL